MNNKIQAETPLGTKTFKVDDIVQASRELRAASMLGHGFKLRTVSIVNDRQVRVRVVEHNSFTSSATAEYKKDELRNFEFKIAAQYLEPIKTKTSTSSISGFGF